MVKNGRRREEKEKECDVEMLREWKTSVWKRIQRFVHVVHNLFCFSKKKSFTTELRVTSSRWSEKWEEKWKEHWREENRGGRKTLRGPQTKVKQGKIQRVKKGKRKKRVAGIVTKGFWAICGCPGACLSVYLFRTGRHQRGQCILRALHQSSLGGFR